MDARLVWNMWRRILTDDTLVEMVTGVKEINGRTDRISLSAVERVILDDYASTPEATDTNVRMYRRGLVRIALAALNRVPLSRRLLYMSELDVEIVAAEFARANGYADGGPNFWHVSGAFLSYLANLPEFSGVAQQDVLALDQALIALAQRLGETPVDIWPDTIVENFQAAPSTRFVVSRCAILVKSQYDLTSWIENPQGYDPAEVLPVPVSHHNWLIYFPNAESAPCYAEISARSALIFDQLAELRTANDVATILGNLTEIEVLGVIKKLGALGVIDIELECGSSCQQPGLTLIDDDAFVMLDPAVDLLSSQVADHRLLCHGYLEACMAVPPGDGLLDFVTTLMGGPIQVGELRKAYDDQRLIDSMIGTLWQSGFLHRTSHSVPASDELEQLRLLAKQMREKRLCHTISVYLDSEDADDIPSRIEAEGTAPELHLFCTRLSQHASVLADLASLRGLDQLRLHHTMVQTIDPSCATDIIHSLRQLCATVIVESVNWPAPSQQIAGLAELTQGGVPVHALMIPDRTFLDAAARESALTWASTFFLSGLWLKLDVDMLWPAGMEPTEEDFNHIFEALRMLENAFGDVRVVNMPSDEVLLGNAASSCSNTLSETAKRFRQAYMHWRVPLLKLVEGDNTFSQTPEAEEKLVRLQEDLLPNQPQLLKLINGSVIVDVCGGNGRVARRLSPLVGQDGLVISVESMRCVTDRARRFACDYGFTNVQFRTGLAQRIPLPDGSADAAVNEWTGAIWQLGLGSAMVSEMSRVVRSGGRIAVTHRLVRLPLASLGRPWVQFENIYDLMMDAFAHPNLTIIQERIWGQTVSTLVGEKATAWRKCYMPRLVNPFDVTYTDDDPSAADVYLTIIAERN